MMDMMSNVLAPRLEVGQDALLDALKARDSKRATRIVKRVASDSANRRRSADGGAASRGGSDQKAQEADLNAPDRRGLRPIHLAAMQGMSETVAALINAGVPPDAMGAEGNTALHLASWHKEEGVVAVLMRAGASPTLENAKGSTAIDLAQTETTLTLLCPIHYCAAKGMLDNLLAEIAKGRSVNSSGRGGDTPLHAAATTGNTDATRLLLARGADALRKNAKGETPLDVARRRVDGGHWHGVEGGRFGGGGGDVVEVLERAVEEAAATKAKAEAAQAAKFGKVAYHEGEAVMYIRDGGGHPAVVMKVHLDDEEPYYTVRMHATGREKQTDANHLVRSLSPEAPEIGAGAGGDSRGEGEEAASNAGDVPDCKDGWNNSSSSSGGYARDSGRDAARWPGADGDAWAAASAKLLDLGADLSRAASAEAPGASEAAPLAQTLAAAFSAMPAAEVSAILVRKIREEAGAVEGKRGHRQAEDGGQVTVEGGCGDGVGDEMDVDRRGSASEDRAGKGGAVVVASAAAAASSEATTGEGEGGGKGAVGPRNDEREVGELVAHAVADTCRDIVLTCLLGAPGKQR